MSAHCVADLGSNDVGWSDPTVLSPTIDALAMGGIRLPHTCAFLLRIMATLLCGRWLALPAARWRSAAVTAAAAATALR